MPFAPSAVFVRFISLNIFRLLLSAMIFPQWLLRKNRLLNLSLKEKKS